MLQHVEGASWTVNYYSQVLGPSSEPTPQDLDKPAAQQQYCLITDMELKVTASLQQQQDAQTNAIDVVGTATTFARFIPNKGDMFIADIGDARLGVFTLTAVEKKSYHKDAVYQIEYKLVDYATSVRTDDLEHKTVKRSIFRKDFLQFGQNPLILNEDFEFMIGFEASFEELLGMYMHDFFSREYQTLLIPDQLQPSYDPFLTRRLLDFIGTEDHPFIKRMQLPNVPDIQTDTFTVWDCLIKMSKEMLPIAVRKARLLHTVAFKNRPTFGGIYFTGLKYVMYPRDNRTDVDAEYDYPQPGPLDPLTPGDRRYTDLQRLLDDPLNGLSYVPQQGFTLPDIVPVTVDDFYVFSEGFYRPSVAIKSNMERLVKDALEQKALDKTVLARLAKNAHTWGNLERFYYIPALLALLKVAIRTN